MKSKIDRGVCSYLRWLTMPDITFGNAAKTSILVINTNMNDDNWKNSCKSFNNC